jgi:hypothetical protein
MKRFSGRNWLKKLWVAWTSWKLAQCRMAGTPSMLSIEAALHREEFLSQQRPSSSLKSIQLMDSGPPRSSGTVSHTERPMTRGFEHIY